MVLSKMYLIMLGIRDIEDRLGQTHNQKDFSILRKKENIEGRSMVVTLT